MALCSKKKQRIWIWKVLDSITGQLLEWEIGDRSSKTLKLLWDRIKHWKVLYYCTDKWESYAEILPFDKLVQTKSLTYQIEQNNSRQRHWFARFKRKSIVVSKSIEMIELTMLLFSAFHVNKSIACPFIDPSLFT